VKKEGRKTKRQTEKVRGNRGRIRREKDMGDSKKREEEQEGSRGKEKEM
jgi:hypothetical protein